jgi:hypothetical protein
LKGRTELVLCCFSGSKEQGGKPLPMQSTRSERLEPFRHLLQDRLFGVLEERTSPLSKKARLLVSVLSTVPLSRFVTPGRNWVGRPAKDRLALASAFIAKAVYGVGTTRGMLEQLRQDRQLRCLCGWNNTTSAQAKPDTVTRRVILRQTVPDRHQEE